MLFEGEKKSILTAKKCREMLNISEENTYGQSHSAAWFPKDGRPISALPPHFKSVTPTYSEKVSRRDIRRIKFLKALWKSVAGKEIQIIPLRRKRWAERCPFSGLVKIMSINTGTWEKDARSARGVRHS